MNKTYIVQDIINWYKQFNNHIIKINSKEKEFEIKLDERGIGHLLGLHYINKDYLSIKGRRLLDYVTHYNLSDQDILAYVELNNRNKLNDVANRIYTFKQFMENLETGYIVEQTNQFTKIKSEYLVLQTKDNLFLHLGIKKEGFGELMGEFEVDTATKNFLETYLVEDNNIYFSNSKICQKIECIAKYDEHTREFIPFSFDAKKNEILLEAYKQNPDFNYQDCLVELEKDYEDEFVL